jgi:sugar phosphate isomerase/epimerase
MNEKKIHVNIPFEMLIETYLNAFLENNLNPEIGFDGNALDKYSIDDYKMIAHKLQEKGLSITLHAPFWDLSPGSPDHKIWRVTKHRFNQMTGLLKIFKPKSLVCHLGYDRRRHSSFKDKWIKNSIKIWAWLEEKTMKEGVVLSLENVYEEGPDECLEIVEKLKYPDSGLCLDVGHLTAFGNGNLQLWLEGIGGYVSQLHLHDNNALWDDHMTIGQGKIDFKILFDYMKNLKENPPIVTIEPHMEEDVIPSLKYIEKIWPW